MARRSLAMAAAIVAAGALQGCAVLPGVLAAVGQVAPLVQIAGAVAVDLFCSELVGADGRDAFRSHVYGDRGLTLLRREGC